MVDYEIIDIPGHDSYVDKIDVDLNDIPSEAIPYMDLVSTAVKDHTLSTDDPVYYSVVNNDSNKLIEAMPYVSPIMKHHSKMSNNDYEVNAYDTSDYKMSDTPSQYEVVSTPIFRDSIVWSVVGEEFPDDEQIYEDPGHKKEEIYSWFEEKKFQKIRGSDIK